MQIKIGKTTKRPNSTSRKFDEVQTVGAWLKDATSVVNPVLKVTRDVVFESDVLKGYNFVYINDFKRYYYIDNIVVLDNNYVTLSLTEDTLASFYTDISKSYHLFDRTPVKNDNILESTIPMSKIEKVAKNTVAYRPADDKNVGIYIDIAGQADPSCNPTTTTYYMSVEQLKVLMSKVYNPQTYAQGTGMMDIVSQTVCNPSQYIVGCRIGRLSIHEDAPVSSIKFGWLDIPIEGCYKVQKGMYVVSWSNTIEFPSYENESNHRYQLYIPCHGSVQLTPSDASGGVTITTSVDMSNGSSYCVVTNARGKVVHRATGQMLIPVPITGVLAKLPSDISGLTNGIIRAGMTAVDKAVKSLPSAFAYAGATMLPTEMMNEVMATLNSSPKVADTPLKDTLVNSMLEWSVKTTGGSGTLSELFTQKNIIATTTYNDFVSSKHPTGYDNYVYNIPGISGYYRAIYTEINCNALAGERNDLISKLYSGFYYES